MSRARVWLLMMVCGLVLAVALPAAAQAIGIEKFVATNCEEEECGEETVATKSGPFEFTFNEPKPIATEKEKEELIAEGFTQAGGRVPFGVTDFLVASIPGTKYPEKIPAAATTHIRTDVGSGPRDQPLRRPTLLEDELRRRCRCVAPRGCGTLRSSQRGMRRKRNRRSAGHDLHGFHRRKNGLRRRAGRRPRLRPRNDGRRNDAPRRPAPRRAVRRRGQTAEIPHGSRAESTLRKRTASRRPRQPGRKKSRREEVLIKNQWYSHSLIKGNVEWGKEAKGTAEADYHDYFEIESAAEPPLLRSRLTFFGQNGNGAFITNATSCPGHLTTSLTLEGPALVGPEAGKVGSTRSSFTTPTGLTGCNLLEFPINFGFHPSTTTTDSAERIHGGSVDRARTRKRTTSRRSNRPNSYCRPV